MTRPEFEPGSAAVEFPGGKTTGGREADHLSPTSAEDKEYVDLYICSLIRLHGVMLNQLSIVPMLYVLVTNNSAVSGHILQRSTKSYRIAQYFISRTAHLTEISTCIRFVTLNMHHKD
jgi:hypothetical protein